MFNLNQLPSQMTSSPLFKRAQEMADGKSSDEIQQIAKNICAQRGVNFDEALTEFKKIVGK